MSYATLMIGLDIAQSNEAPLRVSSELATQFNARVIGVAASDIQPQPYFVEGAAATNLLDQERAWLTSQMAEREAEFRRHLGTLGDRIEWRSALEWPTRFLARNARAADLIVIGGGSEPPDASRRVNPGELVLQAGRPVLMVPPQREGLRLKTVVVAWKDTREARRAVNDALPLLHLAREVVIIELIEDGVGAVEAKFGVDDVARWLTRRGINASSISTKALIGVAGHLSILAQDEGADVIVAGAYGRTRFQEWLFGGVTRELISQQKHCVLLSH